MTKLLIVRHFLALLHVNVAANPHGRMGCTPANRGVAARCRAGLTPDVSADVRRYVNAKLPSVGRLQAPLRAPDQRAQFVPPGIAIASSTEAAVTLWRKDLLEFVAPEPGKPFAEVSRQRERKPGPKTSTMSSMRTRAKLTLSIAF
jgi:hypothetical protein